MSQFPRFSFGPLRPYFSLRLRKTLALGLVALLLTSSLAFTANAQRGDDASHQNTGERATFQSSKKTSPREFAPGRILVRYRDEGEIEAGEVVAEGRLLRTISGNIPAQVERFDGSNLVKGLRLVRVAPEKTLEAVEALNADPNVLYAEPDYILRSDALPNDPSFGQLWGLKNTGQSINGGAAGTAGSDIDAELAWNTTTGSSSVVVGIIDTGVDINHPDLSANIWVNPGESGGGKETNGVDDDGNGKIDDVNGWDFRNNDKTVYDGPATCTDQTSDAFGDPVDEHGTHVAGTIGGRGNNNVGVTGINWQVKMMPLKYLGPCGTGNTSNAISAIGYAVAMRNAGVNLRVLNNSWGGGGFNQALLNAIQSANNVGILFVAAAGNGGDDGVGDNNDQTPHYPSSYDVANVLAVASTTRIDSISSFSNFSPNTVHLGAPGSTILSTTPENTYSYFSGTSMATPHVSGVAALVIAAQPGISLQRLRSVLMYSGDSISALAAKTVTGRRLNANLAIQGALENDLTPPGAISDLHVTSQNGRSVTLAWTAPGDDGASGQASLYDISFADPANGTPTPLTKIIPGAAGTQQSFTANIPYRHTSGTFKIRTFDNVGNENTPATLTATVSLNAADPYTVAETSAAALSTGGTSLGLHADDSYTQNYQLPFSFPFFGQARNTVTISTNGVLYFGTPADNDAGSSSAGLNALPTIAGLWDDLRTDRAGGDIFIVQPSSNRIIFRWQGVTYDTPTSLTTTRGENPVSFEIELQSDGTIITRYGSGNANVWPVVGISAGEPDAYVVASHTSEINTISLNNAQTVTFAPRGGVVVPAPSNNDFAGAQAISGCSGNTTGTNVGATAESGEQSHNPAGGSASKSTWYTWQAPASASVTINTVGSSFDTVLAVYTGSGVGSLSAIAKDDDGGGSGTSSVTFTATAGAVYRIAVDGKNGAEGNIALKWSQSNCVQLPAAVGIPLPPISVSESQSFIPITVSTSSGGTVRYQTSDTTDVNFRCDPTTAGQPTGVASRKCDYHIASGKLRFGAGETSKQIVISLVNDVYVEGSESFTLTYTIAGIDFTQSITILDDDTPGKPNPIDGTTFYVRQLYVDLLSREPDQAGWNGWVHRIDFCGQPGEPPPPCDRVTVGGDGFLRSGEFFDREFFVLRLYRTGLGRILTYNEVGDLAYVSGFLSASDLELNKQELVADIMSRNEFTAKYNGLSNAAFVDTLLQTAQVTATMPATARNDWVAALNGGTKTRAVVYREISERQEVADKWLKEAQVVSAYYGFFTRNPDGAYLNYLQRLESGEINLGDLANAFINAAEYRQRFGP